MDVLDLKEVRLRITAERELQGLNQRQLASRAGIDQGHMSRIEAVEDEPMRDLAARIIFTIVRRGLDMSLSSFFARIEGLPEAAEAGQDRTPPLPPVSPADETVPTLTAEELHTIRALTKVIRADADREHEAEIAQSQRGAHRRYAAGLGRKPKAASAPKAGGRRPRATERRRLDKKVKRTR